MPIHDKLERESKEGTEAGKLRKPKRRRIGTEELNPKHR
jgi:hypothetical protein